jgi:hypothetical protein
VTRFRPRLSKGKHEWIYQLARKGFDLGKRCWGLDGPYVEAEAKWRPRHVTEYSVVEHDLQVNAWVMAFRGLAGDRVIDWLGPDQGRIDVPTTYENRRFRQVGREDSGRVSENYRRPRDLQLERFAPLYPDATVSLYSHSLGSEFEILIELDRTRRPTKNVDKLRRYDAFLTAWYRVTDRYRNATEPPRVVFVCPSEQQAKSLMRVAERMLFVAEEDVHVAFTSAWMLPRHAPGERESAEFWAVDAELPLGR